MAKALTYSLDPTFDINVLSGFDSVQITGNKAIFDGSSWTEQKAESLLRFGEAKKFAKPSEETKGKAYEPDEEDKRILGEMGIDPENPKGIVFVEVSPAANTKLDRDEERFTPAWLAKFADLAQKEKLSQLFMHNRSHGIYGKVFRAFTKTNAEGGTDLVLRTFIYDDAEMPNKTTLAKAVRTGGMHTSIAFAARPKVEELPDGRFIGVFDYKEGDRMEALENSFVHLGAQRGAGTKSYTKIAGASAPKVHTKAKRMITFNGKEFSGDNALEDLKKEADSLKSEMDTLKAAQPELEKAKEALEEIRTKATNDIKNLQGKEGLDLSPADQWDDEEIAGKSTAKLLAKADQLKGEFEKANGEQTKGAGGGSGSGNQDEKPENVSTFY